MVAVAVMLRWASHPLAVRHAPASSRDDDLRHHTAMLPAAPSLNCRSAINGFRPQAQSSSECSVG